MAKFKIITLALLIGALAGVGFVLNRSPKRQTERVVEVPTIKDISVISLPPVLKDVEVKRIVAQPGQVLFFNVPVDFQSVNHAINFLEGVSNAGIYDTVYIVLDSPGGSVIDGANLISYMKASTLNIKTVCAGLCASMAAQIHQAGSERMMTEKAILMFHPASRRVSGSIEQILNQMSVIKRFVDRLDAEVAARSGIPYEIFKQMIVSELWIEAIDAKDIGLTDSLAYVYVGSNGDSGLALNLKTKMGHKSAKNAEGVRDIR